MKVKKNLGSRLATLASIIFLSVSLLMAGCNKSNDSNNGKNPVKPTPEGTTSLGVYVDMNNPQTSGRSLQNALGTVDQVDSIKVTVKENGVPGIVQEINLTETPPDSNIWTGTLNNLAVGVGLDFFAMAYKSDMQAIFQDDGGEINKVLTKEASNDNVAFKMEAIDDGVQPVNPKIASAAIPQEIQINTTGNTILFNIEHGGDVLYYVTVEDGVITSPAPAVWATHDPAAGGLEISYDASSEVGIDTITLEVKDPIASDIVSVSYPVNIVDKLASSNISVLFGPVIAGMKFHRDPDDLDITVLLDSAANPSYDWQITGNFKSLFNPAASQASIAPFSNADSGEVKVTVTDEDGIQASLTRNIADGDFPYIGHELVEFQEVQAIPTSNASDWEYFTIGGESYLAVANGHNGVTKNIDSKIYKWNGSSFVEVQTIPTSGAFDWEYFTIGGESYLAVANNFNDTSYNIASKIYKWNGSSFVEIQAIPTTNGAVDWEYFTIGGESYLAVANNFQDGNNPNFNSKIYKWDGSSFVTFQDIPTNGATDWEYFTIGGESYLAVANSYNGSTHNVDSRIYKWNGSSFVEIQAVPTSRARDWEYFTIGGESYLAVANSYNGSTHNVDSRIYKWNGGIFVEFQTILTNCGYDWKYFTIGGESYLAMANANNNITGNIDSRIYKWNGGAFVEFQTIPTSTAFNWEYFTIGGESYLAVANMNNDIIVNIDSKIYKAVLNDYGVLLLHMDGDAQTFTDTLPGKHPVTAFGDADQSMDHPSKFGKSAHFDGAGDYLSVQGSPEFDFGADKFTVDFWVYPDDASVDGALFTLDSSDDQVLGINIYQNDLQLGLNGSWSASDSDVFGAAGQWYHVAVIRESADTVKAYVNGTLAHTVNGLTGVNISGAGNPIYIGRVDGAVPSYFNGYIDELRISKGVARWLVDFTPPAAPY